MSRIGKQPIELPAGVQASINDSGVVIKGPKGELSFAKLPAISLRQEGNQLFVEVAEETEKENSAIWGLTRSLIANIVKGVSEGHQKFLELEGVGYKVNLQGNKLVMSLGFSHPVEFEAPKGITFSVEKNAITISGIDKELVGQVAANIRKSKKPEPYKGKGIRYKGEVIRRKSGKKAGAA